MQINLKKDNGALKAAPWGFSVTTFFFGPFVPLFRGDFLYFILMLIAMFCTWGISGLIFPFFYNKLYVKRLIKKGYMPADEFSEGILRQKGIFGEKKLTASKQTKSKTINPDIVSEIDKIFQLKEKGIITSEEFEQQKGKLFLNVSQKEASMEPSTAEIAGKVSMEILKDKGGDLLKKNLIETLLNILKNIG